MMLMTFLLLVCSSLCALLGCGYLALSQKKHLSAVFGSGVRPNLQFPAATFGWLLLGASLIPCLLLDRFEFALLVWFLVFACAAFCMALLLAFRPTWLRILNFVKLLVLE